MEETKTAVKTPTKKFQHRIELPLLTKKPLFYAQPLLLWDVKTQTARFNMTEAFALLSSLQLTMSDLLHFGEELREAIDENYIREEQLLVMVDCRGPEMRALYRKAANEFLTVWLPNTFIKDHYVPYAHLATVLLKIYEDRLAACEARNIKRLDDPASELSPAEKAERPVLVLDAFQHAAFLQDARRSAIAVKNKTFLVGCPGLWTRKVAHGRENCMKKCAKFGEACPDALWTLQEQQFQLKA